MISRCGKDRLIVGFPCTASLNLETSITGCELVASGFTDLEQGEVRRLRGLLSHEFRRSSFGEGQLIEMPFPQPFGDPSEDKTRRIRLWTLKHPGVGAGAANVQSEISVVARRDGPIYGHFLRAPSHASAALQVNI